MNRGRSTDSLDNSDDIMRSSSGSSSPTDMVFTSDDESKHEVHLVNPLGKEFTEFTSRVGDSLLLSPREMRSPLRQSQRPLDINMIRPSTSGYNRFITDSDPKSISDANRLGFSRESAFALAQDDDHSPLIRRDNWLAHEMSSTDPTESSDIEAGIRALKQISLTSPESVLTDPKNIASRLCLMLLDCKNLVKAMEFVEENRHWIYDITKPIREAPAFRNYDFSLYQTDYTVKESFNQNFWLDREPIITTADGNCQYHAVSLSLTGTEAFTPQVRLATAVAVIDNYEWFDSMLKLIDRGSVLDLVHTIARNYSWGDETTLKAISVAIGRRIFLYTCNVGKKDYELVKTLSGEELLDAFKERKYRGGTGIHAYADPLIHVNPENYIMLFHKSEHFIAVLPTGDHLTMFEPYNPILPTFS